MAIKRTTERIDKTAEVFTCKELINELLSKFPQEIFSDPSKTFLEPAAGDGNFLVEVVKKKLKNGMTPPQALWSTYGIELMHDNTKRCKERLLEVAGNTPENRMIVNRNIVCAEIKWEKKNKSYFLKRIEKIEDLFKV